ncbi:MAG: hypothetical protein ACRDPR_17510, partial [Nocardioidaceae bacterium]
MRSITASFLVAPPSGARVRTRLRLTPQDARVLWVVGEYLGRLASTDLTLRCHLGHGDDQRAERKRTLTRWSSSRWAGALTRTSADQWARASDNLLAERASLR